MRDDKGCLGEFVAALIIGIALWIAICICIILGKTAFGLEEPCDYSPEEIAMAIQKVGAKDEQLSQYAYSFANTKAPIWHISIAAVESGWGRSKLAKEGNLYGLKNKNKYVWFQDKNGVHGDWCIEYAEWVFDHRFGGCGIYQMSRTYSGVPDEWLSAVTSVHNKIWRELQCQNN